MYCGAEMVKDIIRQLRDLSVKRTVSEYDTMYFKEHEQHYFSVGRSAITAIYTTLCARLNYHNGSSPIEAILDFGCGYGRVARYLKAAFPDAVTYVTDLDRRGVNFCTAELDCADGTDCVFDKNYDLIWLGSVFTHLPESKAKDLLTKLSARLKQNGLFVFTSQGRYSAQGIEGYLSLVHDRPAKAPYNLPPDTLFELLRGYYRSGYGFANYPNQQEYGIAITSPIWFQERVCNDQFLQILLQEKGWDVHQDVNAFIRVDLADRRRLNF